MMNDIIIIIIQIILISMISIIYYPNYNNDNDSISGKENTATRISRVRSLFVKLKC